MKIAVYPLLDSQRLLQKWRLLFDDASPGVFLSPSWLEAWLEAPPHNVDRYVVEGRDEDRILLIGIVGALRGRRPLILGANCAHLHEYGEPAHDAVYIEYNDFLVAQAAPSTAREEAVAALVHSLHVDEIVFRNVRSSLFCAVKRVAAELNLATRILRASPTFQVDLQAVAASADGFITTRSSSFRSQLRRSVSLYEAQDGGLSIAQAETEEERAVAWDDLVRLHQDSWRARGEGGVFSNDALSAFHKRFMKIAPERAHLLSCRAGDKLLGCLYNLVGGDRVSNYQSGFLYVADNKLKPGIVTHAMAIDLYTRQGFSVYDLLAGDAPYKRRLGVEGETLTTIVLERRGGIGAWTRKAVRRLRGSERRAETRRT